jgi:SLAP domain-containing protein
MKKIYWVVAILILVLVVSGIVYDKNSDVNKTNKNNIVNKEDNNPPMQKFTFGPKVSETEVSEETKNELQKYINELGEPKKDNISFDGFSAKFKEDDALILSVFVRNGYDYSVYNLDVKVDIKNNGEVIASANFKLTEEEFGILNGKESRVWNLVYEPEHVLKKDTELKEYILEYSIKHSKK